MIKVTWCSQTKLVLARKRILEAEPFHASEIIEISQSEFHAAQILEDNGYPAANEQTEIAYAAKGAQCSWW